MKEHFVNDVLLKLVGVRQAEPLSNDSLSIKEKNLLHLKFVSNYIALFVLVFSLDTGIVSVFEFVVKNYIQLFGIMFSLMVVYVYSIYTETMYEDIKDMQTKVFITLVEEISKKILRSA